MKSTQQQQQQQQQQTKGRRDFPLLHILFLACFFSFQLSRISRLFQNDEKENLKDFRARTIQKFTKEGIPNFLKIKKFASPIISRLSFYGEVLKTTHTHSRTSTHTHTQETKKKKERIMSRNGPVHLIFFFLSCECYDSFFVVVVLVTFPSLFVFPLMSSLMFCCRG